MHQREKHLRCPTCNKRMLSVPSLTIHASQMHNITLPAVPNAISGRDSVSLDVLGMKGIPSHYYDRLQPRAQQRDAEYEPPRKKGTPATSKHSVTPAAVQTAMHANLRGAPLAPVVPGASIPPFQGAPWPYAYPQTPLAHAQLHGATPPYAYHHAHITHNALSQQPVHVAGAAHLAPANHTYPSAASLHGFPQPPHQPQLQPQQHHHHQYQRHHRPHQLRQPQEQLQLQQRALPMNHHHAAGGAPRLLGAVPSALPSAFVPNRPVINPPSTAAAATAAPQLQPHVDVQPASLHHLRVNPAALHPPPTTALLEAGSASQGAAAKAATGATSDGVKVGDTCADGNPGGTARGGTDAGRVVVTGGVKTEGVSQTRSGCASYVKIVFDRVDVSVEEMRAQLPRYRVK